MCEICDKLLSSSASRKRHLKCVHGLKLPPVISNSDNNKTCDLCNKTFSSKFAKERHTSEVHDTMRTECSKPTAVQCKECGVNFSRLSIYRQHLQQFHNIETTTAQYEFASEEGWFIWLLLRKQGCANFLTLFISRQNVMLHHFQIVLRIQCCRLSRNGT